MIYFGKLVKKLILFNVCILELLSPLVKTVDSKALVSKLCYKANL